MSRAARRAWELVLACGLVLLLGGCGGATEPEIEADTSVRFTLDGLERSYTVHLPTGHRPDTPSAVLLALHGGGGSAGQLETSSGLDEVADARGFIVVYGQGTTWGGLNAPVWNAGGCCGRAADDAEAVDDVGYAREVLRRVSADYAVDPDRVFVAGMSNGAMMAERLACETADLFRGAASVSGALQSAPCEPDRPIAVLLMHGTDDPAVPYEGGTGTGLSRVRAIPVEQGLADWATRNGCTGPLAVEAVPALPDENGRTVELLRYTDCRAETALYRIAGGIHEWPGGPLGPFNDGEPTTAIRAADTIADFFGL